MKVSVPRIYPVVTMTRSGMFELIINHVVRADNVIVNIQYISRLPYSHSRDISNATKQCTSRKILPCLYPG